MPSNYNGKSVLISNGNASYLTIDIAYNYGCTYVLFNYLLCLGTCDYIYDINYYFILFNFPESVRSPIIKLIPYIANILNAQ